METHLIHQSRSQAPYRSLLGCPVSPALFRQWRTLLVSTTAPFYLPDAMSHIVPPEVAVVTREELRQQDWPLAFTDSYALWRVHRDATLVALLAPEEFRRFPPELQTSLLQLQWELGRGQIYAAETLRTVLGPLAWATIPHYAQFMTDDGLKVALDAAIWQALDPAAQWQLLSAFIDQNQPGCCTAAMAPEDWQALAAAHPPIVAQLAGSFAWTSGPNCFATALAATTTSLDTAQTVASLWLFAAPFLRGLAARGYHKMHELTGAAPAGGVLVWQNASGDVVHACYCLGDGLVLNKDSQTWYTPRMVQRLEDVLSQWADEPYAVLLYLRDFI